jgi:hypothetical protein
LARSRGARRKQRIDIGAPGAPGGQALDAATVPPEYLRAFGLLAFAMGRFIVDHVIRSARLVGNDTEALAVDAMRRCRATRRTGALNDPVVWLYCRDNPAGSPP